MTDGHRRLDLWLWYARVARQRTDCAALIRKGRLRINGQPTDKPHARVHREDVLTIPMPGGVTVRVLRVVALGERRGNATEASMLYEEIVE
ncbi:RNA-binding S4 domain-containing protein [Brytella acorum]|uniref:S4 domain-containing protein n=1 Tax=Brytella acorum TaxID=2959299 RepID=A0AA35UY31_9PROT|nr:S4 domain-containing protein [Brytella acorum]MDF3624336.1 S4 domain-containing protein [Brytella acorum]CAI9121701.1 S4 domain-containing protein [Brytella acorum]